MSLVGKKPIEIPSGTKVAVKDNLISVEGPLGKLDNRFYEKLELDISDNILTVKRPDDEPRNVAMHGLWRSLINNMVVGVSSGFEKRLELIGTGYRVQKKGANLELSLGFSHPVSIKPLGTNSLENDGNTIIVVKGNNKQSVGEQAARIRKLRKPNPYTGKGIKYEDEVIMRKAGKKAGADE